MTIRTRPIRRRQCGRGSSLLGKLTGSGKASDEGAFKAGSGGSWRRAAGTCSAWAGAASRKR